MLDHLGRKTVASGEYVFRCGDVGDCAYIIDFGLFEVVSPTNDQVVARLGPGELFGEVALIDHYPRTASVRAVEDAMLIEVKRDLVAELLDQADPVIRHLLLVVLERFRSSAARKDAPRLADNDLAVTSDTDGYRRLATERLTLMEDLDYALKAGHFELYYQPIFAFSDRTICGFEALIRWQHPQLGLVAPSRFLPLAEKTGQIRQIGMWTLEQACADWSRLKTIVPAERAFVSVNLSANQLTSDKFADEAEAIIRRHGVNPREIKLELTETTIITNPDLARQLLQRLAGSGCSIALDDYGTGYSGLDHLKTYPFYTLKLDQSFIRNIRDSALAMQLVRSSIEMAQNLKLDVVAEGIEDEETAKLLQDMGCDFAQGYLFAKPMRIDDLLARFHPD